MNFTELRFVPFLALVFLVHWALPWHRARKAWLLAASYVFYGAWDARFCSLLLLSTVVDYVAALRMVRPSSRKRAWLALSLLVNLGLLGYFKYANFFLDSTADFVRFLGFRPHLPTLRVILPVGISFYTFQTMSYSIDVYYGRLRPSRDFLDVAMFVSFFPQLVAGPIVRALDFMPQLDVERRLAQVDVRGALMLFWIGLVKKGCISDNVAPFVDRYFAQPEEFNALGAWAAALFYSIQIYCDFSGYSDMALATAALFGYRLCLNFYFPYFATSVTDFWRRWHVSMSSWLRDYLYIPLGGNRGTRYFVYRNLTITLVLCGLWHGAAWHFVVFGAIHAAALGVRRELSRSVRWWPGRRYGPEDRGLYPWIANALTYGFFVVTLIVFRGGSMDSILVALRSVALLDAPGTRDFGAAFLWIVPALGVAHWVAYRRYASSWWRRVPLTAFAAAYAVLWGVSLSFLPTASKPFLYFQF